jgi:hypothetical protein
MPVYSGSMDAIEFDGKDDVRYLLNMAAEESPIVFPHDPEYKDEFGTLIVSNEQKTEIREVIQRLRKIVKSSIDVVNGGTCRITTLFISTRFDEDGWDGEQFHGIEFVINYYYSSGIEYIRTECRDKIVTNDPRL